MQNYGNIENRSNNPVASIESAILRKDWTEAFTIIRNHREETNGDLFVSDSFPNDDMIDFGHASANARWRDPNTTRAIMQQMTERFPLDTHWWWIYIDTLIHSGRLDQAESILEAQKKKFPECTSFTLNSGFLALKQEKWNDAILYFKKYLTIDPENETVKDCMARAQMELGATSQESAGASLLEALRQNVGVEEDDELRSLLLGFESLGSDCEFGLVQRRYAAEPLGLFRWNSTKLDQLIDCIAADLEGLGEPENTVMSTWEGHEYYLSDKRWDFGFHTFLSRHEIEADKLYPKMCKRMVYLRDKFISDMKEANKTFIFKSRGFDRNGFIRLHSVLQKYGPASLIAVLEIEDARSFVQQKYGQEPAISSLYELNTDVFIGVVSAFGNKPDRWDIRFSEWIDICKKSKIGNSHKAES